MNAQILHLDRIEFSTIKIETNSGEFTRDDTFPQLTFDFDNVTVLTRSDLLFPPDQAEDPRAFILIYGIKVESDSAKKKEIQIPYDIEIEALGYFRYVGGDEFKGAERFRAVRFSGYQILYGAIREMVSNLTARGRNGLWHLPARNFGAVAKSRSDQDEENRQELLKTLSAPNTPAAKTIENKSPKRNRAKQAE
ncbi:hypothetical protein [Variovorax guangxiensis]|uniref:Preprotein translocase subunit SecB n=1 Tax=Variovorax guangxiensis TaxID=1775474 RepID=A0A840G3G1_9BURK|nr:hypothetical protein [Variovorax guangxiensis]MBB4226079.1 preprotein translocase subunit SecB [Variovorax guangxiensis]